MPYDEAMLENERRLAAKREEERRTQFHHQQIEARQTATDRALEWAQANGTAPAAEGSTAARIAKQLADNSDETRQARRDAEKAAINSGVEQMKTAHAEAARLAKQQPQLRAPDGRLAASSAYFAAQRSGEYTDSAGIKRGEPGGQRDPERDRSLGYQLPGEFDIEVS
jgi:hypothetical protein